MTCAAEPAALTAECRLLLASALQPGLLDARLIRDLADQVTDWDQIVSNSAEHLAIPFVRRLLAQLGGAVPAAVTASVATRFRNSVAQNLRIAAMLVRLHDQWFAPRGVRYAAVKGVAVAQRYYGNIAARSCRDLDLLVDPAAFAATTAYLCSQGYRLCRPFELPADQADWPDHIAAVCDLNREVTLRSPDDDLVDVHSSLDLTGRDFPTAALLDRVESVTILNRDIPTLSTADLFVFICYHHSRHNWTRLHWVADLGQIANAPSFDLPAVRTAARSAGMEKLVLACLEMPRMLAGAVAGRQPSAPGLAGVMVRECLAYLQPGAEAPMAAHHRRINDGAFRWKRWFEITGEEWRQRQGIVRKLRSITRSMTPSWALYRQVPLPRRWRWLYVPLRIGSHLIAYTPLGRLLGRSR